MKLQALRYNALSPYSISQGGAKVAKEGEGGGDEPRHYTAASGFSNESPSSWLEVTV